MLEHRFLYARSMDLTGFPPASSWYGGLSARLLEDVPVQQVFDRFADRVMASVSREFLPVYRMADGEFEFISGKIAPHPRGLGAAITHRVRRTMRSLQFETCWGESYSLPRRKRAIGILRSSLREISRAGCMALYFMERADGWSEEYFAPTCRWLEDSDIALTTSNYLPFYLVYALLSGRPEMFRDRRVLVVTHVTAERREAIETGLRNRGAAAVEFIQIPATGAIFTKLDLTKQTGCHDLAIVAAGIGSAAILCQLAPLSIPAIDAGMWVDCLVRPERREDRPFLLAQSV